MATPSIRFRPESKLPQFGQAAVRSNKLQQPNKIVQTGKVVQSSTTSQSNSPGIASKLPAGVTRFGFPGKVSVSANDRNRSPCHERPNPTQSYQKQKPSTTERNGSSSPSRPQSQVRCVNNAPNQRNQVKSTNHTSNMKKRIHNRESALPAQKTTTKTQQRQGDTPSQNRQIRPLQKMRSPLPSHISQEEFSTEKASSQKDAPATPANRNQIRKGGSLLKPSNIIYHPLTSQKHQSKPQNNNNNNNDMPASLHSRIPASGTPNKVIGRFYGLPTGQSHISRHALVPNKDHQHSIKYHTLEDIETVLYSTSTILPSTRWAKAALSTHIGPAHSTVNCYRPVLYSQVFTKRCELIPYQQVKMITTGLDVEIPAICTETVGFEDVNQFIVKTHCDVVETESLGGLSVVAETEEAVGSSCLSPVKSSNPSFGREPYFMPIKPGQTVGAEPSFLGHTSHADVVDFSNRVMENGLVADKYYKPGELVELTPHSPLSSPVVISEFVTTSIQPSQRSSLIKQPPRKLVPPASIKSDGKPSRLQKPQKSSLKYITPGKAIPMSSGKRNAANNVQETNSNMRNAALMDSPSSYRLVCTSVNQK